MTLPPTPPVLGNSGTSTRPYLIRALHEWCTDNGFTPYIAVFVGPDVKVPMEYVKNGEIVLNVGFEATTALELSNERIEFKARFGGTSRDISVPVDHVIAIYARENGQGMAFRCRPTRQRLPDRAEDRAFSHRNPPSGSAWCCVWPQRVTSRLLCRLLRLLRRVMTRRPNPRPQADDRR